MCFERKFHVPVIVCIFDIIARIMHTEKTPETDVAILFAVFDEMLHQAGYLNKLVKLCGRQEVYRQ